MDSELQTMDIHLRLMNTLQPILSHLSYNWHRFQAENVMHARREN